MDKYTAKDIKVSMVTKLSNNNILRKRKNQSTNLYISNSKLFGTVAQDYDFVDQNRENSSKLISEIRLKALTEYIKSGKLLSITQFKSVWLKALLNLV